MNYHDAYHLNVLEVMQVRGKSFGDTWYYYNVSYTSFKFSWGGSVGWLVHLPGYFQPWTPQVIWVYNASARIMKCRMVRCWVRWESKESTEIAWSDCDTWNRWGLLGRRGNRESSEIKMGQME